MTPLPLDNKTFISLREKICKLGSAGFGCFPGYDFEGGYRLQQNPDEFAALCLLLLDRGPFDNYLEIGTASGGTCLALHELIGFKHVFTIDDGKHGQFTDKFLSQIPGIQQFLGDSHSLEAKQFLQKNVNLLDVVFFDGDHRSPGLWKDVQMVIKFCHEGTLFIFHDAAGIYRWTTGVKVVWERCIQEKLLDPLALYVGRQKPTGIGIGSII